jgi:N,N-dimethylformamidase
MKIVGYSDRLSAAPGETLRFMVSCELATYQADIVRLIHGDLNPRGPGFKEELVSTAVSGEYPGRKQEIYNGSYVIVPDSPSLRQRDSFTLQAWVWPTTPQKGVQGILTKWSADGQGYGLLIDEHGELALWLGDPQGRVEQVHSSTSLRAPEWYFVAATYDGQRGRVCLYQEPLRTWSRENEWGTGEQPTQIRRIGESDAPFLMAGHWHKTTAGKMIVAGHFNGKIDSPRLFNRALNPNEIAALKQGMPPTDLGEALVAAWDFAADVSARKVADRSPQALHGQTVNMPARAMTGYNWTGAEPDFRRAIREYGAIHFHDDDLDDARWEVDFVLTVPAQLKSGVYAARLRAENEEDYIPFFVRPQKGTASARIAFLAPTNSYLAYANLAQKVAVPEVLAPSVRKGSQVAQEQYMIDHGLVGLYDRHSDGSGVCYSSRLRPIVNMRPKYNFWLFDCPHQFAADLHLVDWLEATGYTFDVFTDEDLHVEGTALLSPYKVIVTGTHPEYWSEPMLAALETYLQNGGRLMYLGGNGFYWVTSIDPERPHVIEVRRWGGIRTWEAAPGEYYHSTTGEPGGLWRFRGKAPQKLVGVGFTAQGFDRSAPYRRQPGSFDPRAAFIFEGVGREELIGDFPSLVLGHGAAGFELDRVDPKLGTPPHTLVLASSYGHSDAYQHVVEEVLMTDPLQGGSVNPEVRADMVYFEYANGGAVFATGSIAWCGALSYNKYENHVSRITDNVLRRFASDEPL